MDLGEALRGEAASLFPSLALMLCDLVIEPRALPAGLSFAPGTAPRLPARSCRNWGLWALSLGL